MAAHRSPYESDHPSDLSEADAFEHGDYARALASTLKEAGTPFTVGMFGPWGVGKSSILEKLHDLLRSDKDIAFVLFDAWRYEGDALRRQFLRDIGGQLEAAKQLDGFTVKDDLRDLDEEVGRPEDNKLTFSWPEFQRLTVTLAAGFVLLFVILKIADVHHLLSVTTSLRQGLLAFVGAGFVSVVSFVMQPLKVEQRLVTLRRLEDPDRFTTKFLQLMKAVKPKRVVIAIDNLDRCSPEHAVEVLSTIKTYLEPSLETEQRHLLGIPITVGKKPSEAVFLVAADNEALRRHLVGQERGLSGGDEDGDVERYVDEYLRKFFSATMPVRELLDEDLRRFIEFHLKPVAEAHNHLDDLDTLTQICTVGLRHNPRRVKQFRNNLELRLRLLKAREQPTNGGAAKISPPISGNFLMVAKLLMIEEEWPARFALLQHHPRLLESWEEEARGRMPNKSLRAIEREKTEDLERFTNFLRESFEIQALNLRAFIQLKQSQEEVTLPGYIAFRDAVTQGNREAVQRLLDDKEAPATDYAKHLPRLLEKEKHENYLPGIRAVIEIAVTVPEFAATDAAGRVVFAASEDPALKVELVKVPCAAVLSVAKATLPEQKQGLVQTLFAREMQENLREQNTSDARISEFAGGLAAAVPLEPIARAVTKETVSTWPQQYESMSALLLADRELITGEIGERALDDLTADDPDTGAPPAPLPAGTALSVSEAAIRRGVVSAGSLAKLLTRAQQSLTPELLEDPERLVAAADRLSGLLGLISSDTRSNLDDELILLAERFQALGTPPDTDEVRVALLRLRYAIWAVLDGEDAQTNLARTAAHELLRHHPGSAIEFIAAHPDRVQFPDEVAGQLAELTKDPEHAAEAAHVLDTVEIFSNGPELVSQALTDLARQGQFELARHVFSAERSHLAARAGALAGDVIALANAPTQPEVLTLITDLADYVREEDLEQLQGVLLRFLDGLQPAPLPPTLQAVTLLEKRDYFAAVQRAVFEALSIHLTNLARFNTPGLSHQPAETVWTFLTERWEKLAKDVRARLVDRAGIWLRQDPACIAPLASGIERAASTSADTAEAFVAALLEVENSNAPQFREPILEVAARICAPRNRKRSRAVLKQRVSELEASGNEQLTAMATRLRALLPS